MALIFGNSNDPVLVKKIYLKIWSLRSEIESVIKLKSLNGKPLSKEEIQEIHQEYQKKEKTHLKLVEAPTEEDGEQEQSGDDLEAEMAAALEEGGDEASEEEPEQSGDDLEAEMAAALNEGSSESQESEAEQPSSGPVSIIQRGSQHIPEDQLIKGMTILSEVGIDKIHFFSQVPFLEGQSIVLEFQIPQRFVVNANIHYCRPFNISSRIISENRLPYRVVANFTFLKEGERTLLRNFVESIEPEVSVQPVIKQAKADDEEGDDFDDLDGLDF